MKVRPVSRADVVLVVPLLAAAAASFGPVGADARWLVAVGSELTNGHLVHSLPFATAPTEGWTNVPALGELVFHALWSLLGERGLVLAQVLAVLVGFGALARGLQRETDDGAAVSAVLFVILAGSLPSVVVARNGLFSLALFPLLLLLLEREQREPSRRIWLAVPLIMIWTNLHGAVLVGYALLAAYIVFARRRAVPVLVVSAFALCATPELWDTPRYYAAVSVNEAARMGVGLWAPLGTNVFDVLYVFAALTLGGIAVWPGRRRWRPWEAASVVVLAAASVHAARFATWLLFVLAYPAVRSLRLRWPATVPAVLLAALGAVVVGGLVHTPLDAGSRGLAQVAARSGLPVLAEPVAAEQVAVAGGLVWVGDPLEAFRHRDQRLYLDWAAGKSSGRTAVGHARLVLVRRASPAGRAAARDPRLVAMQRDRLAVLYRVRPNGSG